MLLALCSIFILLHIPKYIFKALKLNGIGITEYRLVNYSEIFKSSSETNGICSFIYNGMKKQKVLNFYILCINLCLALSSISLGLIIKIGISKTASKMDKKEKT